VANNAGDTVASGTLSFNDEASGYRTITLTIDKTKLNAATTYWLVVSEPDGTPIRRWSFRVE
jgi:hypothetical protein